MNLLGWAADDFPVYCVYGHTVADSTESSLSKLTSSYRVKERKRRSGSDSPGGDYDGSFTLDYEYIKGSGDLDECGGHYGVTPEFPEGTYYYILTVDYPFMPRIFRGTPDSSFKIHGNRNYRGDRSGTRNQEQGNLRGPPPPHRDHRPLPPF